ncbi:MAG TPA: hypothetical protein VHE14_05410 [Solirubrobacteraceae bacterium]|nr:hypothetical protein [Solirubrobacteraceae bacterium]
MRSTRAARVASILAVVLVFLAASILLARVLAANGVERSALISLAQSQARGDEQAILRRLRGCAASAACRASVRAALPRLRRAGKVRVLRLDESTSFTLSDHTGTARIAWNTPSAAARPAVECVTVQRRGNPFGAMSVELDGVRELPNPQDAC